MSFASPAFGAEKDINIAGRRSAWAFWLLTAIVLASIAAQIHWGVNTNTSWNITLAEKVLQGQRPNIDFFEINPPLSYLIYAPPTLAAKLIGARAELMVDLFCFLGAGLCLWLSGAILARGGVVDRTSGARLALVAAMATLLLPASAFSEREHIAFAASLPCLAALTVLATGRGTGLAFSALAGLGAGVAMSIKPHFALFFLPGLIYVARGGGWRRLAFETGPYIALAVVAFYWIAVAIWLPAFFEFVAPIVRDIYVPDRKPLEALLGDPSFLIWAALGSLLALTARRRLAEPLVAIPALASLGAMGAYVIQGKYWPYQAYPGIALMALALGPIVLDELARPRESRRIWLGVAAAEIAAALLVTAGYWLALRIDRTELEKAVAAIAEHPKILAISPDIETGHPITRQVHGLWVGSTYGPWITQLSMRALERSPSAEAERKYRAYMRFDRERLTADIVNNKPDVILIANKQWLGWARSNPDVEAALAGYGLSETVGETIVYARAKSEAR
jgi:hypothetical protein